MAITFRFTGFDVHDGARKKEEIREAAHRMQGVYPGWLKALTFQCRDETRQDADASCHANYSGRFASILIYSGFWDAEPELRWNCMLHEVAHITLAPVDEFFQRAYDQGTPEFTYSTAMLEQSVQDLADSWYGYVPHPSWVVGALEADDD